MCGLILFSLTDSFRSAVSLRIAAGSVSSWLLSSYRAAHVSPHSALLQHLTHPQLPTGPSTCRHRQRLESIVTCAHQRQLANVDRQRLQLVVAAADRTATCQLLRPHFVLQSTLVSVTATITHPQLLQRRQLANLDRQRLELIVFAAIAPHAVSQSTLCYSASFVSHPTTHATHPQPPSVPSTCQSRPAAPSVGCFPAVARRLSVQSHFVPSTTSVTAYPLTRSSVSAVSLPISAGSASS